MLFSICLCSRCCKGNNCFIPVLSMSVHVCACLLCCPRLFLSSVLSPLPFMLFVFLWVADVFCCWWVAVFVLVFHCSFFCASFRSVVCRLCFLRSCLCVVSHSFRSSLSYACCPWLCVCGFCCGPCCLYFLPLLLFITSFVLVSVILCVCMMEFFDGWQILIGTTIDAAINMGSCIVLHDIRHDV